MTEDEAKTKRCPLVSGKHYNAISGARQAQMFESHRWDGGTNCIGSTCMMWRWVRPSQEAIDEVRAIGLEPMMKSHGYCGLAGKP